jgi:hypothetical protein
VNSNENCLVTQDVMDDINLFSVITVLSFLLSCPLMLFAEGIKFTPGYLQSSVSVSKFRQDTSIVSSVVTPETTSLP